MMRHNYYKNPRCFLNLMLGLTVLTNFTFAEPYTYVIDDTQSSYSFDVGAVVDISASSSILSDSDTATLNDTVTCTSETLCSVSGFLVADIGLPQFVKESMVLSDFQMSLKDLGIELKGTILGVALGVKLDEINLSQSSEAMTIPLVPNSGSDGYAFGPVDLDATVGGTMEAGILIFPSDVPFSSEIVVRVQGSIQGQGLSEVSVTIIQDTPVLIEGLKSGETSGIDYAVDYALNINNFSINAIARNGDLGSVLDFDGDGLLDADELTWFDDLDETGLGDFDEDELTNAREIYGSKSNPLLRDSDGDKFDDKFEVDYGLDPNTDSTPVINKVVSIISSSPQEMADAGLYTEDSIQNLFVGTPLIAVDPDTQDFNISIELQVNEMLQPDKWTLFDTATFTDSSRDRAFYRVFFAPPSSSQ